MSKIIISEYFRRESKYLYKKYISLANEVAELIEELKKNPQMGTPIGRSCYKICLKISSKNTGKSGGARVITYVYVEGKTVTLLSIYDKSEQENILDAEIKKRLESLD
jgi:mRNA-degrading endonuclease RelE of RelBE toxin-antitoxin system